MPAIDHLGVALTDTLLIPWHFQMVAYCEESQLLTAEQRQISFTHITLCLCLKPFGFLQQRCFKKPPRRIRVQHFLLISINWNRKFTFGCFASTLSYRKW